MKKIAQFRYRGEGRSADNFPSFAGKPSTYTEVLTMGNLFHGYGYISKLGIQGPPGLYFYLNSAENPIMIGKTGIYELDLEGVGRITSIRFDKNNLDAFYKTTVSDKLLIDIVYEG